MKLNQEKIESEILRCMFIVAEQSELKLVPKIESHTPLLETGLDSLAFAVLIAILHEELGYDPFTMMDEPYYPHTFGEFVSIYKKYAP